jgi:hypothetical protein
MGQEITLSQGLTWMNTLKDRYKELIELRNRNSSDRIRRWGETKEDVIEKPVYDVKHLDKMVNRLALEIRKLDDAIKTTNANINVINYEKDDSILGELE